MRRVGASSLRVAVLGVIGPFLLGWGVGAWFLPDAAVYVHVFLGATLTATSVGITARVLKDLGRVDSPEGRIILGASVVDDVLGLVVLAVVVAIIEAADRRASISIAGIVLVIVKAALFLFGSLASGLYVSPRMIRLVSRMHSRLWLVVAGLAWCGLMAMLATVVGLSPIVGAFAAGLVLEDPTLSHLLDPLSSVLAPIFFLLMGLRTDLSAFAQPGVLALAGAMTAAAILGKLPCGFGASGRRLDRLSISLGMIPRGEVGLIFANIGLALHVSDQPVVSQGVLSAVVVMVMVTTFVTPPALKWSFERAGGFAPD
jgi:Kef-type K+ transport system membrane component KefB